MGEQGYRYFTTHKYISRMFTSFFPALAAFIDFLYVLTYFQLGRLKDYFCTDRLFPYFYERTFTYGTLLFGIYDTSLHFYRKSGDHFRPDSRLPRFPFMLCDDDLFLSLSKGMQQFFLFEQAHLSLYLCDFRGRAEQLLPCMKERLCQVLDLDLLLSELMALVFDFLFLLLYKPA